MRIVNEMNQILNGLTLEDIQVLRGSRFIFPVYLSHPCMENDIMELELSVRSYNCLKRANIHTLGELVSQIQKEDDLKVLRNLGARSAKEIMFSIFVYQFSQMDIKDKYAYMDNVLKMNGIVKK